jgi:hypothetical protein
MFCQITKTIVVVVAFVLALGAAEAARAVGYWNVPGSTWQWWGYGCGAGYHAKLVLGPISVHDALAHNEVRLPYAPQPPSYCGYYGCACDYGQPSVLTPGVQPENILPASVEVAPEAPAGESSVVAPTGAPRNALFGPPVEQ